jgi:hypothetical protein
VIGLEPVIFLSYPDLRANRAEAIESLRRILIERHVDALFVPWALDGHVEHRLTNIIVAAALEGVSRDVRVFGYEVWGMCIPNVLVVIDDVIDKKCEMLSCFYFANKALDYVNSTKGLNMFHWALVNVGTRNASSKCLAGSSLNSSTGLGSRSRKLRELL